jgi:hypothetical protein
MHKLLIEKRLGLRTGRAEAFSFGRIAGVETNNYLPNYYIAFINITQAFQADEKRVE